jgi:hypothetical protein
MGRWAERYDAGQHTQVWTEMLGLGADVRAQPQALNDAVAVARLTMTRARSNIDQLVQELPATGYEFAGDPHLPPTPRVVAELDALEAQIGRLPLALRIWFEEIGQVNFVGSHPGWAFDYPDPLVVYAPIDYIRSEHQEWIDSKGTELDRGSTFEIPLAPDYFHKANVSGGVPYSMTVPADEVDGLFLWEPHQTTFVNYLRIAFQMAGMPGFGWQGDPPAELLDIASRLAPL